MLNKAFLNYLSSFIFEKTGNSGLIDCKTVTGGDINEAYKIEFQDSNYFLKVNSIEFNDLFESEANGLKLLNSASAKTPSFIGCGIFENVQFLILEFIATGYATNVFWKKLGNTLASVHAYKSNYFGLEYSNYLGSIKQLNKPNQSWHKFYSEQKLEPVFKTCYDYGLLSRQNLNQFKNFLSTLPELIPDTEPCLLHGDLWSGNFMVNKKNEPVFIDPAVYYGHPESEIAFTLMFGGFDSHFYHVYFETATFQPGFEDRVQFHNLFPYLVHLQLFGESYLNPILNVLSKFN